MTAASVAHALAGRGAQRLADGGYLVRCPVPTHGQGRGDRRPSLRIGDGVSRLLVHCFAGCDPRDVLDALRRRGLIENSPRAKTFTARKTDDRPDRQHDKAAWMWSRRQPINGTIAERYLRARGYTGALPPTLGFLPPYKADHHPALIAAFAFTDELEPGVLAAPRNVEAVHLTLLRSDGSGKADCNPDKITVGSPTFEREGMDDPIGLPITIAPPNDLLGLAITEGLEDALSAHSATGLGAWAAGSAGFMPKLANAVPGYIKAVTIYAHDDKAGRKGALGLAKAIGYTVNVRIEGLS